MTSENDVPKFLRFCDLQDRGLAQSHAGLRHLQLHEGFPLGRLLGPSTRVWTVAEVNEWLASRPVEPSRQTKERAQRSIDVRRKEKPALARCGREGF
jgi:hypothetical protein